MPIPAPGSTTISTEDEELNTARQMVDMSLPLSHPCIGEAGRDVDELLGDRNPGKRDDVGRYGAPT
jgi:hypothetical protein